MFITPDIKQTFLMFQRRHYANVCYANELEKRGWDKKTVSLHMICKKIKNKKIKKSTENCHLKIQS